MKIAILLISRVVGGTERRFPNLLRYLIENSNNEYTFFINKYLAVLMRKNNLLDGLEDIIVELPRKENFFTKFVDSPKLPIDKKKINLPGPNFIITKMKDFFRNWIYSTKGINNINEYDVVHIALHYGKNIFSEKVPKVLEAQNAAEKNNKYNSSSYKKLLFNDNYSVNCASEIIRDRIINMYPHLNQKRFFVFPCSFIDYSKTRIDEKEKIIVFAARLIEEKNPVLFIKSIKLVKKKNKDVKVYILGRGKLKNKMVQYIKENNLEKSIEVGFVSEPINIFLKSLIFVSLQASDNYPSQSLMEAMACGCAIVASNVGETWRLVSEDVGFRVKFYPEIIARKIIWLLNNPKKAKQMGINAREKVMKEQNIVIFSKYIEDLYNSTYKQNWKKI